MFRIFWQVWIGEIGKKDYQNAEKKEIVTDGLLLKFCVSNISIFW